jgi:hypothetical protein
LSNGIFHRTNSGQGLEIDAAFSGMALADNIKEDERAGETDPLLLPTPIVRVCSGLVPHPSPVFATHCPYSSPRLYHCAEGTTVELEDDGHFLSKVGGASDGLDTRVNLQFIFRTPIVIYLVYDLTLSSRASLGSRRRLESFLGPPRGFRSRPNSRRRKEEGRGRRFWFTCFNLGGGRVFGSRPGPPSVEEDGQAPRWG